jgi:hypothetical protein
LLAGYAGSRNSEDKKNRKDPDPIARKTHLLYLSGLKAALKSSRLYIVKQDRLSTGEPDAVNVAFIGTSQQGTTPVDGLF